MDIVQRVRAWLESHREIGLDLLRVFLGIGLFVRGALFVAHPELLLSYVQRSGHWFWPMAISHYVALAHLGGGILLALGLTTRWAAAAQIPVLIGAVFFVHLREGLFAAGQSLELSAFVLFALAVFAAFGPGPFSVDARLKEPAADADAAARRRALEASSRT